MSSNLFWSSSIHSWYRFYHFQSHQSLFIFTGSRFCLAESKVSRNIAGNETSLFSCQWNSFPRNANNLVENNINKNHIAVKTHMTSTSVSPGPSGSGKDFETNRIYVKRVEWLMNHDHNLQLPSAKM